MKTLEKYTTPRTQRVVRNAKVLYNFAKYGKKGLSKVNPTLVYIDAIISLMEFGVACFNYSKEKEINKQLKMQLEIIKEEYESVCKILEKRLEKEKLEKEIFLEELSKEIEKNELEYKKVMKIYNLAKNYFYELKVIIEEMEENELKKEMIIKFYEAREKYILTLGEII